METQFAPGPAIDEEASFSGETGLSILMTIVRTNLSNVPAFLRSTWRWLLPLALFWIILWIIPNGRLSAPLSGLVSALIFLTATYNNFIAKTIFVGIIYGTGIPLFTEIRQNGPMPTATRYLQTVGAIAQAFRRMGSRAVPYFLSGLGMALFAANFLSRNNKMDKYFISLLIGFVLFRAMSRGLRSIQMRLVRAVASDLSRRFPKLPAVQGPALYVLFTGFSLGFAGSFVSAQLYGLLGDYTGYILGLLLMIGAVALFSTGGQRETA